MTDTNILSMKNWIEANQEHLRVSEVLSPPWGRLSIIVTIESSAWHRVSKPDTAFISVAVVNAQKRFNEKTPAMMRKPVTSAPTALFPTRKRGRPRKDEARKV